MLNRKLLQYYSCQITSVCKSFSTAENVELVTQQVKKNIIRKPTTFLGSAEIRDYLKDNNTEYFEDIIPKKILRRNVNAKNFLYLIDKNVAKSVTSMISEDLLKNTSFVIECNPGLGLLTKELLNVGVPSINLYEKCNNFISSNSPLISLIHKYQSRLHLREINFFDLWMILLREEYTDEKLSEIFLMDTPFHPWKKKTFAQIIAICPNRAFLSLLLHNFFQQTSIFDHGRPTFYLVLSSAILKRINMDASDLKSIRYYSHYNVIFKLFFECKIYGEVPRKAFLPWPGTTKKVVPDPFMSVIKLEPKTNTFSNIEKEDLKEFWFFLKAFMRSRKLRVIYEFERLLPGSGEKLIDHNIDICTTFKELSPEKLLELFKIFKSCPAYDKNLFIPNTSVDEPKKEEEEEKVDLEEKIEIDEEQNNEITSTISNSEYLDLLKNENVN